MEGTWKLAPIDYALAVGPNLEEALGPNAWYYSKESDVTTRSCLFDDQYIFDAGTMSTNDAGDQIWTGQYTILTDGSTWIETWQGSDAEGCGEPVAPHNEVNAPFFYEVNTDTDEVTLNGVGAYFGLAKATNEGELSADTPPAVPTSITYTYIGDDEGVEAGKESDWIQTVANDLSSSPSNKVVVEKYQTENQTSSGAAHRTKSFHESLLGDVELGGPLLEQTGVGTFRLRASGLSSNELNHPAQSTLPQLSSTSAPRASSSKKWSSTSTTTNACCCRQSSWWWCCSSCGGDEMDVPFVDYMPGRFEDIRIRGCNVKTSDYVRSLRKTTKERFSEGASGAFLFFSADQKYVIKSMTEEEHQVLLDILPSYHDYIITHPNTLLTRFMGCHSVRLGYTGKLYFCVMKNVFNGTNKIHETYDLKGSWIKRAGALPSNKAFTECRFCEQWYRVGGRQNRCKVLLSIFVTIL